MQVCVTFSKLQKITPIIYWEIYVFAATGQQLDNMDQKWQIIPIAGTMFQDGSSVTEYDSPGEEKPRTRRVACTCPNCCDGEKRYLDSYYYL